MGFKSSLRRIIDHTLFRPVHIGHFIRNLYLKKYLRKLPVHQFKKVLDAGCGSGDYALQMGKAFPAWQVTAVDIKDRYFPETSIPNVVFQEQDLMKLKETASYDFIYSIDVLEHIKGNITAIENLCRALKPGGYIFLHIPNDKNDIRIFPRRFFKEFQEWAAHQHIGEQYSTNELSEILKNRGFTIKSSVCTFGFPGKLAWELNRICDRSFKLKVLLMPFFKFLAWVEIRTPHRKGSTLVLAQKQGKDDR
jgi:2-polyprenyl-3-methyl-5-hydroxy-6-metoxy-1,4-benzoquinol methylase